MRVLWNRSRPRWRRVASTTAAVVLATGSVAAITAIGPEAGASTAGVISGPPASPSGFESGDGNLSLETTDGSATDWNCFDGTVSSFPAGPGPGQGNTCSVTTGATQAGADPGNLEEEWKPGQKFDEACPKLQVGSNPPKDEFTNLVEYSDSATDTNTNQLDTFFYGGAIRSTANGNASGDVEFNQVSNGDSTSSVPCRTPGDLLVAYDFLNGGTSLNFHVLTWIDSGHSTLGGNSGTCFVSSDSDTNGCWGKNAIIPTGTDSNGYSNQTPIAAENDGINNSIALAVNQFSEFGINLTKTLGLQGCINFPQNVWESRSSGSSFTSNPEDIEIVHHQISNCLSSIDMNVWNQTPGTPGVTNNSSSLVSCVQVLAHSTPSVGSDLAFTNTPAAPVGPYTVPGATIGAGLLLNAHTATDLLPGTYQCTVTISSP